MLITDHSLLWLLEADNPGVRYLALKDLQHLPPDNPELAAAQLAALREGPIAEILEHMQQDGYWVQPGPGYNPKYFSSVWSLILLAQLGAKCSMDAHISAACRYILDHALTENGQFTGSGAPSGTADCLQGNLCESLIDLDFSDTRLETAFEWMARSVTGNGVAPITDRHASVRYYAGKCGPVFACGANNKLPCAWGAAKVMSAFSKLPLDKRTTDINGAIQVGVDFLFSTDPARADWPSGWSNKPSGNWWKLGFPVFYVTDLLQIVEALVRLGYGDDPRLVNAINFVKQKQDNKGRWILEYDYSGKTWGNFGIKKQANKWVTFRALRVLDLLQRKDASMVN